MVGFQENNGLINEIDNEQELRTVIRVKDEELENIFNQILHDLEHCTVLEMHPREEVAKIKLVLAIEDSNNRVLDEFSMEMKISFKFQARPMRWKRPLQ